jgi:plastocyanin
MIAAAMVPTGATLPASQPEAAAEKAYVVRIALVGMDPFAIEIPVGSRVTFVNNDANFAHDMTSGCKEVDAVGRLEPEQSGQTAPFTTAKTCTYYDRLQPENPLRRGKITVR